ncbi:MAG: thioredoxin family protein [Bacteroidia bacterium]
MRRNLIAWISICAIIIVLSSAVKADRRVRFKKYSWTDIGRSARSQNKMVFVLITGKYCPTSKKMNRVLLDAKVCEFYNKNFVCTVFDAQNPSQYYRASNWGISSIPALVYLDKHREVVHKTEGYLDANGMINEAQTALEIDRKNKLKNKTNGPAK